MGVLPASEMANYVALGELSLDAQVTRGGRVFAGGARRARRRARTDLPGRMRAGSGVGRRLEIIAAPSLIALVNHLKGVQVLNPPAPKLADEHGAPRPI